MSSAGLYLGVDGGASGTRALVLDATGTVRGYGEGGNANHQGQGFERATAHITRAIADACAAAGCAPDQLTMAFGALAGIDTEDDHHALGDLLGVLFPAGRLRLANDVWAGLRAGSLSGVGVAVNCGSGCGAVGRNAGGEMILIPDLGYEFGDSGGGMQIARDAIRAVVRAWDGRGEPTMLTSLILDVTGQPDVAALYLALYRSHVTGQQRRAATRLVFQAAAAGDQVATTILERIGTDLGLAGAAIAQRLHMQHEELSLVLTGGTFRTLQSPLAAATIARMRQTAPRCLPTLPLLMPVAGAALLALDAAGVPVGEAQYARLREQGYGWHAEETFAWHGAQPD
ncbi:MAG TPA: BadF/BadG/BcrA/BcrD ATPase family protein [Chloroflexota bacterium]|nr:BadF/BadG/BcrA/BcrD ATPase family protein [Chloroflexota bacterium]